MKTWFSPHGTEWEAETYEEALEMERDSLAAELERLREREERWKRQWSAMHSARNREAERREAAEAELERVKAEVKMLTSRNQFLSTEQVRADVAEAELERVKAERDELDELLGEDAGAAWFNQKARLDNALTVLREFHESYWDVQNGIVDFDLHAEAVSRFEAAEKAARAAIAEIEGETFRITPGQEKTLNRAAEIERETHVSE